VLEGNLRGATSWTHPRSSPLTLMCVQCKYSIGSDTARAASAHRRPPFLPASNTTLPTRSTSVSFFSFRVLPASESTAPICGDQPVHPCSIRYHIHDERSVARSARCSALPTGDLGTSERECSALRDERWFRRSSSLPHTFGDDAVGSAREMRCGRGRFGRRLTQRTTTIRSTPGSAPLRAPRPACTLARPRWRSSGRVCRMSARRPYVTRPVVV